VALNPNTFYNPYFEAWPDEVRQTRLLAPVRVGVDRHTGRVIVGWNHVMQSITTIFITRFHERVLRRWVGSFVPHLLGETAVERTITRFYWAIATSIDMWEPNFAIKQVRIATREDGSQLTSSDELRTGALTTQNVGVYKPRGHLGDPTPETRRSFGLIGSSQGGWQQSAQ
jgi:phage baseplate assembly protein W